MTPSAIPLSKSDAIRALLDPLFEADCPAAEFDQFTVRRIRRAIEDLAAEDRRAADVHLSSLLTILHDYDGARAAAENLRANKYENDYLMAILRMDTNFLYATAAHQHIARVIDCGIIVSSQKFFEPTSSVGAFRQICRALEKANTDNRVIMAPSTVIPLARAAVPVLDHFGITDEDVAACIDEAGALLRERRLMWLKARPDVLVAGLDSDDPGVSIEYAIAATPAEAAALNGRLADALIEKDLFKPGFSLGFTGLRT